MTTTATPGPAVRPLLTRLPAVASDAENLRKVARDHG
jgi:hypothetical protein